MEELKIKITLVHLQMVRDKEIPYGKRMSEYVWQRIFGERKMRVRVKKKRPPESSDSFRAEQMAVYLKKMYPQAETVYKDAVIRAVGISGLEALKKYERIELCGNIGGRELYAL